MFPFDSHPCLIPQPVVIENTVPCPVPVPEPVGVPIRVPEAVFIETPIGIEIPVPVPTPVGIPHPVFVKQPIIIHPQVRRFAVPFQLIQDCSNSYQQNGAGNYGYNRASLCSRFRGFL